MQHRNLLIAAIVCVAAPSAAIPPPPKPTDLPPVDVRAEASALEDHWQVTCAGRTPARCDVVARFVRSRGDTAGRAEEVPLPPQLQDPSVTVDGAAVEVRDHLLMLPPGPETITIEVRAQVRVHSMRRGSLVAPAIQLRHLAFHVGDHEDRYSLTIVRARRPAPNYRVTVDAIGHDGLTASAWVDDSAKRMFAGEDPDGFPAGAASFVSPADDVHFGGPYVGVGSRLGHDELRVRLGLEAGLEDYLLFGVAYDTDVDHYHIVAPYAEVSTRGFVYLPFTFSAGAGLPIHFGEGGGGDGEIGVRLQVGVHLLVLGFVASFDLWPDRADGADATLLGVLTL